MTDKQINSEKKQRKTQKRKIESREKIRQAALKLFIQKGYYYTNTKEIVKEAGLSIGNYYNYYEDKGSLYVELVKEYMEGSYEKIVALIQDLETCDSKDKKEYHNYAKSFVKENIERCKTFGKFFDDCASIAREREEINLYGAQMEEKVILVLRNLLESTTSIIDDNELNVRARMLYVVTDTVGNDISHLPECADKDIYISLLTDYIIHATFE